MPSKKKKFSARFPPARIKKIMQTDEEVGKVAQAVPVVISRALELFIESLINQTSQTTKARNAKTMTTQHIKQVILSDKKFDFLKELVSTIPDVQPSEDSPEGCDSGATATDMEKPRRKRGRPKRDTSTETQDDVPVRPKRGRPAKKRSVAAEAEAVTSDDDSATEDNDSESMDEEENDNDDDDVRDDQHRNHDDAAGAGGGGADGTMTSSSISRPSTSSSGSGSTTHVPPGVSNLVGTTHMAVPPRGLGDNASHPVTVASKSIAQVSQIHAQGDSSNSQEVNSALGLTQVVKGASVPTVSDKTESPAGHAQSGENSTLSQPLPPQEPRVTTKSPSLTNTTPVVSASSSSQQFVHSSNSTNATAASTVTTATIIKPVTEGFMPAQTLLATTSALSSLSNSPPVSTNSVQPLNMQSDEMKSSATSQDVRTSNTVKSETQTSERKESEPVTDSEEKLAAPAGMNATLATITKDTNSLLNDAGVKNKMGRGNSNSALKDEEDSNHSTDSENTAMVGSHAMNMIMSEYDPQKGKPVAASAAMNMIKDQYNNKIPDVKLSTNSTSPFTNRAVVKNERLTQYSGPRMTLKPGHHIVGFVPPKTESTNRESTPDKPKDEKVSPMSNVEDGRSKSLENPTSLISTKQEEEDKPVWRETSTPDATALSSGLVNHALAVGSPATRSPAAERPGSAHTGSPMVAYSAPSPSAIKSPMIPAAHMAGAPFGLLGAYRPLVGMPGMAMGRIPMMAQAYAQPMLAPHAGMFSAYPGLMAGHAGGMPLTAASALSTAGMPGMAMHFPAAAGGMRYAAAPHFMQAPMMHTVPAATGPYSHLGVPGAEPYLNALASMGVHAAQAAPMAPAAALYPQLQMAQPQALPHYAVYQQARVPFQGLHLPRPPT